MILEATIQERVKSTHPWLMEKDQPMVIHNDLDGLLSGMFMKNHLNWNVVGVYDLETLYLSDDFDGELEDICFVDLDVCYENMKSIGHHVIGSTTINKNHVNVNNLWNITESSYTEKYPLSTIVFLYWLYEVPLPQDETQLLYLLHADSTLKNLRTYQSNGRDWLQKLNLTSLLKEVNSSNFREQVEFVVAPNTYGNNKQCSYKVVDGKAKLKSTKKDIQQYIYELCEIFEFEPMTLPTDMNTVRNFVRLEFDLNFNSLDMVIESIIKEKKLFSYSLKYRKTLNITFLR